MRVILCRYASHRLDDGYDDTPTGETFELPVDAQSGKSKGSRKGAFFVNQVRYLLSSGPGLRNSDVIVLFKKGEDAMVQTIAAELEGTAVDEAGRPVDMLARMGGAPRTTGHRFEELTTDMAAASFEMVTTICTTGEELAESLGRLRALFPPGVKRLYEPRPFPGKVTLVNKSRMHAMKQALEHAKKGGAIGVSNVAQWNALQFHLGVDDVRSPEAVFLLNYFNNVAPYMRLKVIESYGVAGAGGHLMCWQGWAPPGYAPEYRWFKDFKHLESYIATIPKLLTLRDGHWTVAEPGTMSQFGDPESEGTLWWLARLRAKFGTIELRPFPSIHPVHVPDIGIELLELMRDYRTIIARHSDALLGSLPAINRVYADMHESAPWLLPRTRLSEKLWWEFYRQ